ncbi:hypothetical protein BN975_05486 [Mycolicibacterium farcinogenes]|uniref:Uncharacterized protein n=1 Tax=Mycolicibacterium senegalense TaxID=1796 RepID=A0A378SZB5_9MYCO|nr:hypothetical protein BN975_05486 [Mycolicibacterium farcinogenes]STZ53015.1 Uncharacterised protein [Mycolicibacterium senegalense]
MSGPHGLKKGAGVEHEGQEDLERIRFWVERLSEFNTGLGELDGETPIDFCESAGEAWQGIGLTSPPPPTSPAILIVVEALRAVAQVMTAAMMDYVSTPDARDRMTRNVALESLKEALDGVRRDGERWLTEGAPSADEIKERLAAVKASLQAALDAGAKQLAKDDADDAAATADQYGAILGYHDPSLDVSIIFTKVCSFSEAENKRYLDAYKGLAKRLESELYLHISDEHDALCDVLIGILSDLQNRRLSLGNWDALDECKRKVRSALISFTSALQIHQDQTIRLARKTFGRKTPEATAVEGLFNDLKATSFDYRWLEELRDVLQHGDINAFKYQFTASLDGEPEVRIDIDREYMLEFTREARNKPWLKRAELEGMTSDPSVLNMIKAIQPLMVELQEKLDTIMFPNVAEDAAVVKELIGRFNGRRGLYALQTGPGFTRRLWVPPYMPLAPRVLSFADGYEATASS